MWLETVCYALVICLIEHDLEDSLYYKYTLATTALHASEDENGAWDYRMSSSRKGIQFKLETILHALKQLKFLH